MPELRLSRCDVTGIRQLLVVDEAADERERWAAVLGTVARLIPSDWLGIGVADRTGCVEYAVSMPAGVADDLDPQVCDGPLPVGIQHVVEDEEERAFLRSQGIRDTLRVGFPVGQGRVVQLYLDRTRRFFDARDVMLLEHDRARARPAPAAGSLRRPARRAVLRGAPGAHAGGRGRHEQRRRGPADGERGDRPQAPRAHLPEAGSRQPYGGRGPHPRSASRAEVSRICGCDARAARTSLG